VSQVRANQFPCPPPGALPCGRLVSRLCPKDFNSPGVRSNNQVREDSVIALPPYTAKLYMNAFAQLRPLNTQGRCPANLPLRSLSHPSSSVSRLGNSTFVHSRRYSASPEARSQSVTVAPLPLATNMVAENGSAPAVEHNTVLVLDYGSQYTQLITRRIREVGLFSLLWPGDASLVGAKLVCLTACSFLFQVLFAC
jgi:hypothetical protein